MTTLKPFPRLAFPNFAHPQNSPTRQGFVDEMLTSFGSLDTEWLIICAESVWFWFGSEPRCGFNGIRSLRVTPREAFRHKLKQH